VTIADPAAITRDYLLDRLDRLPLDIVRLSQWVLWRNDHRDGDFSKVPYQARAPRDKAKANDPSTWASFTDAVVAFGNSQDKPGAMSGIGYVFSAADPFVGVDLDDCVEGDTIHSAAKRIINALNGYAEISPSGTGVKVWTRGTLPISGTGKQALGSWGGQIEIYHERRWFAVTGWRLDR
jgi:putative DNA primase/helicase